MLPLILNVGLYAGSAILLRLAGFAIFLWLARSLTVADYAAWGLLYALQTGIATFGLTGIIEAVVGLLKERSSSEERQDLFAAANVAFLIVSMVTVVLAALFFAGTVKPGTASVLALVLAIGSGILLAYAALQAQIVRLNEKHLASLCFNFLVPLAGFLGSAVAFYFVRTVASYFAGLALGAGIFLVGATAWLRPAAIAETSRNLRPILLRIHPFIFVGLIGWLSGYGTNYLINGFFPALQVARFTFIFSLSAAMQLVATSMNQVWSPRFYNLIHNEPVVGVERQNRFFFQLEALVLGLAGAGMLLLYPFAIRILGGNAANYADMRPELLLLILGYVVSVPNWHAQNYLLAFDQGKAIRDVHIVTGIVGAALLVLLMWWLGAMGIYLGFLAQMLLRAIGLFWCARQRWPVLLSWQGIVGGALMACCGFFCSNMLA